MPDHGSAAEVSPHQALLRMITGSWVAQAIYVAAKLQIADLLRAGPQASTALAETTGAHPRALYRVLRALASVGFSRRMSRGGSASHLWPSRFAVTCRVRFAPFLSCKARNGRGAPGARSSTACARRSRLRARL